jgi:hypothetical protein
MSLITSKAIADKIAKLADTETKKYRDKLDADYHIIDVSFEALKVSDPTLDAASYHVILEAMREEFKLKQDLASTIRTIKDPSTIFGFAALVYDQKYGQFLVGKSYKSLQTRISKLLKTLDHGSVFTGLDEKGKTVTNIGHIPTSNVTAAKSPLSDKINAILARTPAHAAKPIIEELDRLYSTHVTEVTYNFNRPDYDINGLNKILGTGTVIVTLHSAELNNKFSVVEKNISNAIAKYVKSEEFINALANTPGSNSIMEDIRAGLVQALGGKKATGTKHGSKKPSKTVVNTKTKATVSSYKIPALRNRKGQFYSLSQLEFLLRDLINETVAKNMGPGHRTDILNYRTGRFSDSVAISHLTMSKEGMISVFYNYMKYPYATFSQGGVQQTPASRDPKLLIGKSIREIAATRVANRMRAVLV